MFWNLIGDRHSIMRVMHIWVVVQQHKYYEAVADAVPSLI